MPEAASWAPGVKVGRSVLVASIAAGGMAEIWLARQGGAAGFEKLVVIKRLIGALREDPEHVKMFLDEARLAASLSHRNIVQVFELGEDAGSFFIVMEFVEGESLARAMKQARQTQSPIPPAVAVQLVAWAAEALHYAHTLHGPDGRARGVIHRDVSPQNLLVTADGSIKVVDFGIAKLAAEDTRSGKLKGKLAYMPPEQARAESLDPRADVFSLGVVLFELLTGTRLFGKIEELELLNLLINEKPLPRAKERNAALPAELDAIVARAMAPSRDDRFPTAEAFSHALEEWLASTSTRVNAATVTAWLNSLFPNRAAERRAVLEAAKLGTSLSSDLTSLLVGSGSGSGSQSHSRATPLGAIAHEVNVDPTSVSGPPRRSGAPLIGIAAAAVIALGAVAVLLWPPAPPDQPATIDAGVAVVREGTFKLSANVTAEVTIDGKVAGSTPLELELSPGAHEIALSAPGHQPISKQILISTGRTLQLSLSLDPKPEEAATADAGAQVAASTPVKKRQGTGKLNLKTTPWTTVWLGKRKLGETPLVGVTLPAGSHVLRVENSEAGIKSSIEVVITANQTTSETLSLK